MTDLSLVDHSSASGADARKLNAVGPSRLSTVRLEVTGDLRSIEAEWRAFEQVADCTPFQGFDWLAEWDRNVGTPAGIRPAIVVGRRPGGALLFILPLAIERAGLARTLTFLGHKLCDYNAPLLAPDFSDVVQEADQAAWFDACRQRLQATPAFRHDLVLLDKMPERIGEQRNPLSPQFSMLHPSGAHSTRLAADWEGFYASRSSGENRRRDRARRRQLGEQGEISFRTMAGKQETDAALEILFDYKGRSLTHMGAPNIFAPIEHRRFFAAVAASPNVHVSRLDVGDHCAAVNLGLMVRGCYYHVLTTFDDELRRFAPGGMHLRELIAYAIAHNCSKFDFTVGDEPFKRDWSDEEMRLYDHVRVAGPLGIIGGLKTAQWRRVKRRIKQSPRLWALANRVRRLLPSIRRLAPGQKQPSENHNG
jgi:CelD/BcsL family acetyltransferase involved in cellulose biosynthesis